MANTVSPAVLLDPLLVVLVAFAAALLVASRNGERKKPRWGLRAAWAVWAVHLLLATPRVSFWALGAMETPPIDVTAALAGTPEDRCVMVVLTGGTMSPRPGVMRPELLAGSSLPRAIGAARLYLERPVGHVIITGRAEPLDHDDDTARAMADVMIAFGVPKERIVIEPLALDTRQNAAFSGAIARDLGAEKTLVVTSALHMSRALLEFKRAGFPAIGAPVDHRYEPPKGLTPYVPSTSSLMRSHQVIHELLGRFKP